MALIRALTRMSDKRSIITQMRYTTFPKTDTRDSWPTYGNTILLPSKRWAGCMDTMKYSINPFMVKGQVRRDVKTLFGKQLTELIRSVSLNFSSKNGDDVGRVMLIEPIQMHFPVWMLLSGVRENYLQKTEKEALTQLLELGESDKMGVSAEPSVASRSKYWNTKQQFLENELSRIRNTVGNRSFVLNGKRVLNSLISSVADAIYLANSGLYLGRSKLLDIPIFVVQTPRMLERQLENGFWRVVAAQLGFFPIEMEKIFEGMADLICINRHLSDSEKPEKKVLLGFDSSRSDKNVYKDVISLTKALQIENFPDEVIIVEAKDKEYGYHQDLVILTLPSGKACVGEGTMTDASMEKINEIFSEIYEIPRGEWMRFALNSILVDERLGVATRFAVIPPDCPTLYNALASDGYRICQQSLAYDNGGGYLRCLTLFADTEFEDRKVVSSTDYAKLAEQLSAKLPKNILNKIHFSPDVHERTVEILRHAEDNKLTAVSYISD